MTVDASGVEYISELKAARAEFEHRLRQLNDIVERNGGACAPIEDEIRQVRQNLKDTEYALEKAKNHERYER